MPSPEEYQLMTTRKNAARSATKFFKHIASVKSTNNPFAGTTANDQRVLDRYRDDMPNTVAQSMEDAARTGIGNCDEKGRICYAALKSNPLILGNSVVTLCEAIDYDHVFVVVSDAAFKRSKVKLLGTTAMIVDGWTEDWYFPNLSVFNAKTHSLGNTPNPRQLYVRNQIRRHKFKRYRVVDVGQEVLTDYPDFD